MTNEEINTGDLVTYIGRTTLPDFVKLREDKTIGIVDGTMSGSRVNLRWPGIREYAVISTDRLRKVQAGDRIIGKGFHSGEGEAGQYEEKCIAGDCVLVRDESDRVRHVRIGTAKLGDKPETVKEEEIEVERQFIGEAPKPPAGPKYQLPFERDGARVQDANGHQVVFVDLSHEYEDGDDEKMAETIAEALNAYFAPKTEPAQRVPGVDGLRVLVLKDEDPNGANGYTFEMVPGRFWWAHTRERAIRENERRDPRGWPMTESEIESMYVDVNKA